MKRRVLLLVGSFCLALVSCRHAAPDAKAGLVQAANGADLNGYAFASYEDDASATASFTNPAVKEGITLENDGTVVLRYETVRDKAGNRVTTRREDLVRNGPSVALVVTDLESGRVVDRQSFAIDDRVTGGGGGGGTPNFPLCSVALADYNCRLLPPAQAEANRTCQSVRSGYSCCETPGQNCIIVDTFVPPTNPRCAILHVALDKVLLRRQ